jgi:hypothetical protein
MSMGKKSGDGGAGALAAQAGARADAAAAKITEYGDKAVSFSDDYFEKYVVPQIAVIQSEQAKGIARADEVYGQQQAIFQDREATYQADGKPAIADYFQQVREFDPEAEAQRRGLTMTGDVIAAQANAQGQTNRALAARGLNPNSGAVINAQSRGDLAASLVRAKEMARLRDLTTGQKYDMTAAAAGFGAGLGGNAAALAPAALKAGVVGTDIGVASTGAIASGAGIPMSGLEIASQGQGQLFSNYTSQQTNATQLKAQADANKGSGVGKLVGTVVGGIGGYMLGGPAGALKGASIGSGLG